MVKIFVFRKRKLHLKVMQQILHFLIYKNIGNNWHIVLILLFFTLNVNLNIIYSGKSLDIINIFLNPIYTSWK